MKLLASLAIGVTALAGSGQAALVEYWFNISYVENQEPTGILDPRRLIGVNGTWPPPPLDVKQSDTLIVHAYNGLDKPASIHHHGMLFPNTSFNDGSVGVTQCGIPPGETFSYNVPLATQPPGTYWWHAHNLGEYVDGLRAPFNIHADVEPYTYDDEFTVILSDYYQQEHPILLKQFINKYNPTGAEPVPESSLMYFAARNGTYLPGFNDDAKLNLIPGRTYRLRVVNMAALAMFHFYIDGHDMRVIEVDGVDVEEHPTTSLSLTVAQRFSVLITARNDTSQNFYVHADMNPDMFDAYGPELRLNMTSSIIYDPAAPYFTPGTLESYDDFDDLALVPLEVEASQLADVSYPLIVNFDTYDDGTNRGTFNNTVYSTQKTPALLSAMTMGQDAYNRDIYGPAHIVLEYGQWVEVIIYNTDAGKHPFHIHGHKFQIIHKSYNTSSDDPAINPPLIEGQANPVRRDTVQVPPEGSATIRFRADNPGAWLFHCHIEWHLESGLALVFVEAPLQMQQTLSPPPFIAAACDATGFASSGNAVGLNSTTEFPGLITGPFPQVLGWKPKGIGALAACIITALLGLATVVWYSVGGDISEAELQEEVAEQEAAKAKAKQQKLSFLRGRR